MKKLIFLTLLLSGCGIWQEPAEPLGQIIVHRIECTGFITCRYEAIKECPYGFHIQTYDNSVMLFWCSNWGRGRQDD